MPQHLRLVHDARVELDRDARNALCADAICDLGGPIYDLIGTTLAAGDDDGADQIITRLTDRHLTAVGLYAAYQGDFFVQSLITFEEGRRLGVLQSTTTNGGSAA